MSLHVGNGDKGRFVAEVTDAHEAIRQYEEAADEFVGHQGDSLFSISIFAISVTQGDFSVLDFNDAVIGKRE